MAKEITIPRLGWSMDEGTFSEWLKKDGERVNKGDMLFVLEGDKAAQDIESFDEGILRIPPEGPKPGDVVRVGQVLGYLTAEDEALPESRPQAAAPSQAAELSVAAVASKPVELAPRDASRTSSPRARRKARELGVDWTRLEGTGRNGRVRERDVVAAAGNGHRQAGSVAGKRVPLTTIRRTIAQHMRQAVAQVAPVTLTTTADAGNLVSLREQFRSVKASPHQVVPSYTDVLVKLTALLLTQHPSLTAQWQEDGLYFPAGINIGMAVDTFDGLLVPVVRDVPSLSLRQLSLRTRELIEAARNRGLTAEQMQGGTFTVTSLGSYGIDAFTPIVNWPQSAILGVGRIRREAGIEDDRVVPKHRVTLSLTFDHRVMDGGPAARFLDALRAAVENPAPHLVE